MVGILRQVDRAAPVTPHCPPLAPEVVAARQDYTIKEQGFQDLNGRPMRVIGIGAGASGIYLGIRAQQRLKGVELVIYEKNEDVGGVWLENVYPGAACDVPGHCYTYTFEPNTEWSTYYASSHEICKYFRDVAHKYQVKQFMQFKRRVVACVWNEENSWYDVEIEDLTQPADSATGRHPTFKDYAHNIIWQGGNLNKWKLPDIPGLEKFKGALMHTANFDSNYDFHGKKVSLIGAGSSSIQVLPKVAAQAGHVDAYIRSKAWISLPLVSQKSMEAGHRGHNFAYTEEDKEKFRNDPTYALQYRMDMENEMNTFFSMCMRDSEIQQRVREDCEKEMRRGLAKKPELAELLIPSFGVGCRRITPGPGYLDALCRDNVSVVSERIASADEAGLITEDGVHHEADAIICATGFDTSFRPPFDVQGKDGYRLDAKYAQNPASYLSVALPGIPNFWVINGPQGCGANGSILPVLEETIDYAISAINKQRRHGIKSMMCRPECVEEFNFHTDRFIEDRGVWGDSCSSWYKNGTKDGRVVAVYPATNVAFIETMRDPRWEDYLYEYHDVASRYRVFGNGFTSGELNGEGRANHFKDRLHTLDDIKAKYGLPIDKADLSKVNGAAPLPV